MVPLIPAHKDRVPVTATSTLFVLVPMFISYYAMAVLVLMPSTRLHRLALLPPALYALWNAGTRLDISNGIPELNHNNYGYCVSQLYLDMRYFNIYNVFKLDCCLGNGNESHRMGYALEASATLNKVSW